MPKLYITEFAGGMTYPVSNAPAPAVALPAVGTQVVSFTSASTQSLALGASTRLVRLNTDAPCHILVGGDPTASLTSLRLSAEATEYFGVRPGDKIAVIAGG